MIIRRACCWCGTTLGLYIDTKPGTSHGGCARCITAWKLTYLLRRTK